jgi:glycosidase
VRYAGGKGGPGIDPSTVVATLRKDGVATPLAAPPFDAASSTLAIDAPSLGDGKYTIFVDAKDRAGQAAKTLRLVFWVEADAFDWHDTVIYMAMADRFQDGDTSNDPAPISGVDPRADYHGGDLAGITARINDGTFEQLGVRTLWISPFHQNPADAWPAADGVHQVSGYHGYWPIKPRTVDPRLGGEAALHALVTAAHAHGLRVLQDFVVNHVHKNHDYFAQHPEWFRTGCVCGTANCDWTTHRLDCMFAPYLPDVNWTLPDVNEQWDDDAVWWLDTFDLDGFRIDAVKHVEDVSIMNLTARIKGEFEATGLRVFTTGETAMGWTDCSLECNEAAGQYSTIARYIGPHGLMGQLDFPLYYAVPANVFWNDNKGMIHADYWTQASLWEYPADAIMTSYIGSQDTPRFITNATYRGQDAQHPASIPGNQWDNPAGPPTDAEPYARERVAMAWMMTTPSAPVLYYGDEYGEWGGADPNNRAMWRGGGTLSTNESTNLAWVRALGQARRGAPALRRGRYQSVTATEDVLLFARVSSATETALVAISRSPSAQTLTATLPATLPFGPGAVLHDRLGGADVAVTNGAVTVTLPARGAAILAP